MAAETYEVLTNVVFLQEDNWPIDWERRQTTPINIEQLEIGARVGAYIGEIAVTAGRIAELSKSFIRVFPDNDAAEGTLDPYMLSFDIRDRGTYFLPHPQGQLPGTEHFDEMDTVLANRLEPTRPAVTLVQPTRSPFQEILPL